MYRLLSICLIFLFPSNFAFGNPASFIHKCAANDNVCLKLSANAAVPVFAEGIPELGVQRMDPMFFEKIDASSLGLMFLGKNITFTGVKSCVVEKIQHNENSKLLVSVICTLRMEGQYEMTGMVMLMKIKGKGSNRSVIRDVQYDLDCDMIEEIKKDKKKHWTLKNCKYNYILKGKIDFKLENMFVGNELLSRSAENLLTNKEFFGQFSKPVTKLLMDIIIENINNFFRAVPIEDLVVL